MVNGELKDATKIQEFTFLKQISDQQIADLRSKKGLHHPRYHSFYCRSG
jgi:hypothetical protein